MLRIVFMMSALFCVMPEIAHGQNIGYIERHKSIAFDPEDEQQHESTPVRDDSKKSSSKKDVILIDTSKRSLSFTAKDGSVFTYPVAVGRQGAQWKGSALIGRKTINPVWHPTKNQRKKKRLPAVVRPGPKNPLGSRALYLWVNGKETLYRIHGTNEPGSIGKAVSSGCIRMKNSDVIELYEKVKVGTLVKVV